MTGATVFGFISKIVWNNTNDPNKGNNGVAECINDVCTRQGLDDRHTAENIANIAQWFFIGGSVAVAGGIVLVVTAPSGYDTPPRATLSIAPTIGGAMLRGTW